MNNKIIHITKRIVNRSKETRESYVKLMKSLSKKVFLDLDFLVVILLMQLQHVLNQIRLT
ncbi:MAG: hypothetical protein CM15mP23_10530 [Cryomorphaceae bacterium]|nr:MAG: hypothetical protein CM15mP23_10530 [Cryomorphaceae bacterium]